MSKQIWETRPLEIWPKAKEIRAKWQKLIKETPGLLAHGNTGRIDWSVAFPALMVVEDNPVGAEMASRSESFSRQARLASEVRGWGRELCGYVNNCWGAQFLGRQVDGSPFPLRQLSIPFPDVCDQHTKRGQQALDFEPIPRWQNDFPMYMGEHDPKRDEKLIDHRVYCTLKTINDIERVFGQKFDDETFIESLNTFKQLRDYARDVSRAMMNTPAPLGQKDLYSFFTLGLLAKVDPQETLDLWKDFRDEVQWRVDNKIAAVGTERYRWMEAHPSPWHFLKYYRYMEKYGAVCIGSQYSHTISAPLELKEDGTLGPRPEAKLPPDQPIKTREDAVRAMIGLDARQLETYKIDEYLRPPALPEFATAYHVDGAVMPLYRCGVGCTLTRKEQGLRLSKMGVRVLHYEGSQPGDRNDLDEHRFLDQLDIWMESQGLRKLED